MVYENLHHQNIPKIKIIVVTKNVRGFSHHFEIRMKYYCKLYNEH